MLLTSAILLLLDHALASPMDILEKRQCPSIHIFGARETTAPPGYGSSDTVVNGIIASHPGATSEAINYPACGGQASCGGDSYSQSVAAGVAAAVSAVNSYASQCPTTQLVLVGYSQGSEIFDVAFCGGGDPNQGLANAGVEFSAGALANIKAAIFMGDPLYHYGLPYDVGTCTAGGFDARPAGFTCPNAAKIQSYCDASDPYCCNGDNAATHQGYGAEYGTQAIAFVNSKLSATSGGGGGGPTTTTTSRPTSVATSSKATATVSGSVPKWGQCGGIGYTGPITCAAGSTCTYSNAYYSQCL